MFSGDISFQDIFPKNTSGWQLPQQSTTTNPVCSVFMHTDSSS